MAKKKDDELTIDKASSDFKRAYRAKSKLIKREREDFLFALGEQWSDEDRGNLDKAGIKPVTDNRIAPNIFLLTGLERQNRSDFKAYPEGEEDGIKAEIASALFKDSIKKSGFGYKSSEQFKDGITCGESHLELYLDYSESIINGKPCWHKIDGNGIFPDPACREYDFSDARYVYKVKLGVSKGDVKNLYPEKSKLIDTIEGGKLDMESMGSGEEKHRQPKDYGKSSSTSSGEMDDEDSFDLVERYYKKWVEKIFIGDKKTGEIKEATDKTTALDFTAQYKQGIQDDQALFEQHVQSAMSQHMADPAMAMSGKPVEAHLAMLKQAGQLPPPPPQQDPERYIIIKKQVPEIWCFAYVPGMVEPLADERAWFYPKWKQYPFVPYFARFSTAPITGDDRHLLIQGIVHGVKGAQDKHNRAEMLMLRHLNTSANSGWLAEEDSWVDPVKVQNFGASAGINLEYKQGKPKPERITPSPLSQAHAQISVETAESIKAQLGMNSDLIAAQQGAGDSGRAIALRQKQGLLMVQELYDNLTRSRIIAGKFLLSQMGEIYDTETAIKVLGEAFMMKNFPPVMLASEDPNQPHAPMTDEYGQPMQYDKQMAELAIAEVLSGNVGDYDVSVGEAVASETQMLAASMELKDFSTTYPGLIPPDVAIRHSQLPAAAKTEILNSIQQAQQAAQAAAAQPQQPQPGR